MDLKTKNHEPAFWSQLTARVCRVLENPEQGGRTGNWCDQFVPVEYGSEKIWGHVWIGVGPREHEKWEFVFVLTKPVSSREAIVWATELPPAGDDSSWIVVNGGSKRIEFEPSLSRTA